LTPPLSAGRWEKVAAGPFLDPISKIIPSENPLKQEFDWAIEVGYKTRGHGQCEAKAREARGASLQRKFSPQEGVYTFGTLFYQRKN